MAVALWPRLPPQSGDAKEETPLQIVGRAERLLFCAYEANAAAARRRVFAPRSHSKITSRCGRKLAVAADAAGAPTTSAVLFPRCSRSRALVCSTGCFVRDALRIDMFSSDRRRLHVELNWRRLSFTSSRSFSGKCDERAGRLRARRRFRRFEIAMRPSPRLCARPQSRLLLPLLALVVSTAAAFEIPGGERSIDAATLDGARVGLLFTQER